jgi:hypothetical protein
MSEELKVQLTLSQYQDLIRAAVAAESVLELTIAKQRQRAEPWQGSLIAILERPVHQYQKFLKELENGTPR